jgi:GNAT superfamily N-acetyltransferase
VAPFHEAHRLGPHVVGRRVVVRRVLPGETGPSGGPAMTDVLGVCTSWGAGECVIEPESGPPVVIRLADIVSGKPVPPRPSVRHRVPPRQAQLRALALWPDLVTERVGDWLLRRSHSAPNRRANSVLAFGPPGVDNAYDRVVGWYERPVAAVLPGSAEEEVFLSRGWGPESSDADTLFQIAGVAQARRSLAALLPQGLRQARPASVGLVETHPGVVGARVGDVASGIAAYADDWVGFRSIHVDRESRRQGLALVLMDALLEWGAEQGAITAYLQVLGDNTAALEMYERLGFVTHHGYRYLTPGQ